MYIYELNLLCFYIFINYPFLNININYINKVYYDSFFKNVHNFIFFKLTITIFFVAK